MKPLLQGAMIGVIVMIIVACGLAVAGILIPNATALKAGTFLLMGSTLGGVFVTLTLGITYLLERIGL